MASKWLEKTGEDHSCGDKFEDLRSLISRRDGRGRRERDAGRGEA